MKQRVAGLAPAPSPSPRPSVVAVHPMFRPSPYGAGAQMVWVRPTLPLTRPMRLLQTAPFRGGRVGRVALSGEGEGERGGGYAGFGRHVSHAPPHETP